LKKTNNPFLHPPPPGNSKNEGVATVDGPTCHCLVVLGKQCNKYKTTQHQTTKCEMQNTDYEIYDSTTQNTLVRKFPCAFGLVSNIFPQRATPTQCAPTFSWSLCTSGGGILHFPENLLSNLGDFITPFGWKINIKFKKGWVKLIFC